MPVTKEENDLMTRVENGAPLGEMLRQHYWIPAIPASKLEAGGRPYRVRLLGKNYAAFRNANGEVGIIDEFCPHRKTSMLLARSEGEGLRCIYHGWKLNTRGDVVEAPNHAGDQKAFCSHVRVNNYTVREAGGIVWIWLGQGATPPKFPDLPFIGLPEDQFAVTSVEVPTNWLQGVEASMDSSHVGVLHESTTKLTARSGNERLIMTQALAPKLEFEERPYGFRYAAIRGLQGDKFYARINNFVMPWYGLICAPYEKGPAMVFFSTPVDDTTHRAWFVNFNEHAPLGPTIISTAPDVWNSPPVPTGGAENLWGQNRDLMKRGHASGFPQHLATEDFAMFLGQGPIYDRTDEQLCSADGAVLRVRAAVLKSVREFMDGKTPTLADNPQLDYRKARSVGGLLPNGSDWRVLAETA